MEVNGDSNAVDMREQWRLEVQAERNHPKMKAPARVEKTEKVKELKVKEIDHHVKRKNKH